ncbi:MAG TPA: HNH endonuclease [Candidatus Eisenbacteria bacterium]|nr:HNH endonuclease [Candidatus Eisenbacteria bacterium]
MKSYSFSHLDGPIVLGLLDEATGSASDVIAYQLALIADVDHRQLYAPGSYKSTRDYCLRHLHLSEDATAKRIQAARAALEYPALFHALAENRLHLSGINLLAPHLTAENVDGLIEAATHKSKREIDLLLAERFPRAGMLPLDEHAPGHVEQGPAVADPSASGPVTQYAPGHVATPTRVVALGPDSCGMHFEMSRRAMDKLLYLKELLGHRAATMSQGEIYEESLDAHVQLLEKRLFAATSRPRTGCRRTMNPRHIPAQVKRAVVKRDEKRCTFVADDGRRCQARGKLEFDHIEPVARGGESTVDNLRLRCRVHNQLEAERTFGAEFMRNKREESRARTKAKREEDPDRDVTPWLRALGFRGEELRRGEEFAAAIPDAPLEQRVRHALRSLTRARRRSAA